MKGRWIAVAAAVAMSASAPPAQAKKEVVVVVNNGVYQFVGYSDGTTDGGQGFIHMHRLCQADFGDTARMCTTEEFFNSPNAADPVEGNAPTEGAWIHPIPVSVSIWDEQHRLACVGWSNTSFSTGSAVLSEGRISESIQCNSDLTVTCCARRQ